MGKYFLLHNADEEFKDYHPSCTGGIFHALSYLHWQHNVKKILPYRKHDRHILPKRKGIPKKWLNVYHSGALQKVLVDEASHTFVDQRTTKTGSTKKWSLKARIKALIGEDTSKNMVGKRRGSGIPAQPKLQRTKSIHYLEPSDIGLDEICSRWKHPIIVLPNANASANKLKDQVQRKPMDQHDMCRTDHDMTSTRNIDNSLNLNQVNEDCKLSPGRCEDARELSKSQKPFVSKNVTDHEFQEFVDVLDVFKVNKESFLKFVQKPHDSIGQNSLSSKSSNRKARLIKSGSFPVADLRPSKLEDKHKEVWSFPREEELLYGSEAPKYLSSKLFRTFSTNSGPMKMENNGDRVQNQKAGFESSSRTESKSDSRNSHKADDSTRVLSDNNPAHKRASSFNESLDRYARLFESTFSREENWSFSKSLRFTSEYGNFSGGLASVSFTRISSISHVDDYGALKNDASQDASFSGMPVSVDNRSIASENVNKRKPIYFPEGADMFVYVDANEQTEQLSNMAQRNDSSMRIEYSANLGVGLDDEVNVNMNGLGGKVEEQIPRTSDCYKEQDFPFTGISSSKLPQPHQEVDLESCHDESGTGTEDIPIAEGLEYLDEEPNRFIINSRRETCCSVKYENFEMKSGVVEDYFDSNLRKYDDAEMNYVIEILERSGFIENGFHNIWYASDQPLDQLVLEQSVKALMAHETECSAEDVIDSSHKQMLFDLINESLIQIYDRSSAYYPSALSFSCRIRPMPVGYHLLEEVWASVSRYANLKHELNQTLDGIVGRDLSTDDGWMNLQLDSECIALDLEELIFDEILEEAICSFI